MTTHVNVIADSISTFGHRLTTFEVTLPRIVLAELNTHRVFSRNSASTRAIPLLTQLRNLLNSPFIPERFGINQKGMQAYANLEGLKHEEAEWIWSQAGLARAMTTTLELLLGLEVAQTLLGYDALNSYADLDNIRANIENIKKQLPESSELFNPEETTLLNVHKQLAGRGLEAYMYQTVLITATEFDNFFALRDHKEAQGEIAKAAHLMRLAMESSTPRELNSGEWHLPYAEEFEGSELGVPHSAARCAAVSYNRQRSKNLQAELDRYWLLRNSGHMSPLEHQATPFSEREWGYRSLVQLYAENLAADSRREALLEDTEGLLAEKEVLHSLDMSGNFLGWRQHRKTIQFEENFGLIQGKD